jgi:hypothetical protein
MYVYVYVCVYMYVYVPAQFHQLGLEEHHHTLQVHGGVVCGVEITDGAAGGDYCHPHHPVELRYVAMHHRLREL